jgi:aminoglycoside phosphotransferase (APT) family kinase protein
MMTRVRQAELYTGTEATPTHLAFDLDRLDRFLRNRLPGYRGPVTAEKFRGGQSNPTYKLVAGERSYVLRRRPPGKLLPSAHAIDREFRVMSAVHREGFPVPEPFLYCDDESIVGTAFYIVEYAQGRLFWDADMPGLDPVERAAICDAMNAGLARLHRFDYRALGLGDFGKVGNYCARNLERWSRQYDASKLVDIPDMDWLRQTLTKLLPKEERVALLHGDYGHYNILIHPTRPELLAVLDWEMSTLGDPLVDLTHHLRPWWVPPDPERGSMSSLVGLDLAALGIPAMQDYITTYCRRAGIDHLNDATFYLAYAQYRVAAMIQGVLKRATDGTGANKVMLHTQERVALIARQARALLEQ